MLGTTSLVAVLCSLPLPYDEITAITGSDDSSSLFLGFASGRVAEVQCRDSRGVLVRIWQSECAPVRTALAEDGILVVSTDVPGIAALDIEGAKHLWRWAGHSRLKLTLRPAAGRGSVFVAQGELLSALDLNSGIIRWSTRLERPLTTELSVRHGRLAVGAGQRVVVFSGTSGRELRTASDGLLSAVAVGRLEQLAVVTSTGSRSRLVLLRLGLEPLDIVGDFGRVGPIAFDDLGGLFAFRSLARTHATSQGELSLTRFGLNRMWTTSLGTGWVRDFELTDQTVLALVEHRPGPRRSSRTRLFSITDGRANWTAEFAAAYYRIATAYGSVLLAAGDEALLLDAASGHVRVRLRFGPSVSTDAWRNQNCRDLDEPR